MSRRTIGALSVSSLILALLSCSLAGALPGTSPVAAPTQGTTPTPSATATPTPPPYLDLAEHALFIGDYPTALTGFEAAMATGGAPDEALLGLARTQLAAGDVPTAQLSLKSLITTQPASPLLPEAQFLLGEADMSLKDWQEAVQAYEAYLGMRPGLIDSYVQERVGDALDEAGNPQGAAQAYAAAASAPRAGSALSLLESEADELGRVGATDQALALYGQVFAVSTSDSTKARLDLKMGKLLISAGKAQEGYARYVDAVANYPVSSNTYSALVELVNANVPVDELQRGIVDYSTSQYAPALAALNRYLEASPSDPAKALYYRGLTYEALSKPESAVADLRAAIGRGSESEVWDRAWFELAPALSDLQKDIPGAIQTYLQFVAQAPSHPRAAEALFDAARLAEESGDLVTAASLWQRCGQSYPTSKEGPDCAHWAGITFYRAGKFPEASQEFVSLEASTDLEISSRAFFWEGKTRAALGDLAGAQSAWTQAAKADPSGYYSDRAADLLAGNASPFAQPAAPSFGFDLASERAQAEAWVLQRFPPPTPEAGTDVESALLGDPRLLRGQALWDLGLTTDAGAEFDALRGSLSKDAVASFYLCNYLYDLGYYPGAIFAARQVLDLAGMNDATTLSAPAYFSHVRFGPYFADLILPEAQAYKLDPLLLFAVVRQESLFGVKATSASAAHGLMQILPSTGADVARKLGLTSFTVADLNRPVISLKLGTAYLAEQRDQLGGSLYVALAAYNGGPGNAAQWQALAPSDPDLLPEVIRYSETRTYIRSVYEIYAIYRSLYSP